MDYLAQRKLIGAASRRDVLTNHLALIAPAASTLRLAVRPGFPLAAALGDDIAAVYLESPNYLGAVETAAQAAGRTTGPQEIIAPLAAQKGPTRKLGNGTGVVQAEIKGHYLILMWAEFTSLKSPSTSAQRQQLEQFAVSLVTGSANIDLSTRMLTGKP